MTTDIHSNDPGEPHGKQSEDAIDYPKVIAVGVISLIIFALGTVWAAAILRHETEKNEAAAGGAPARPTQIGSPEIGIVDQVPFITDHRLYYWKQERAAHLNGYGWVDRAKGIAHVPIENAMEAVARGALPPGAPK
jgi:hypothetical protein